MGLLSNVLHDWDDEACRGLLKSCRQSLPPDGCLLINEALLSQEHHGPLTVACLSLHMFIYTEGKQRTFRELQTLLQDAGFDHVSESLVPGTYFSLVVARSAAG